MSQGDGKISELAKLVVSRKYNLNFDGLSKWLVENKAILAGSAALLLSMPDMHARYDHMDFDIWVYKDPKIDRSLFAKKFIQEVIPKADQKRALVLLDMPAHYANDGVKGIESIIDIDNVGFVQFMLLKAETTPSNIVSMFDLTCVQTWYDGQTIHWLTPRIRELTLGFQMEFTGACVEKKAYFSNAEKQKEIRSGDLNSWDRTLWRAWKYIHRGFTLNNWKWFIQCVENSAKQSGYAGKSSAAKIVMDLFQQLKSPPNLEPDINQWPNFRDGKLVDMKTPKEMERYRAEIRAEGQKLGLTKLIVGNCFDYNEPDSSERAIAGFDVVLEDDDDQSKYCISQGTLAFMQRYDPDSYVEDNPLDAKKNEYIKFLLREKPTFVPIQEVRRLGPASRSHQFFAHIQKTQQNPKHWVSKKRPTSNREKGVRRGLVFTE